MTDGANNSNETAICDVVLEVEKRSYGRSHVEVLHDRQIVHDDLINLESHEARVRFITTALQILRERGIERTQADLELLLANARDRSAAHRHQTDEPLTHHKLEAPGEDFGLYRGGESPKKIANFIHEITTDVTIHDADETTRQFRGHIRTADGQAVVWTIGADDYANDAKLKASLYAAAGSNLVIECQMSELRNAVAEMPPPRRESHTTDFGWTNANEFLVPGGIISASGWRPLGPGERTVNLEGEDIARHLGLLQPVPADFERLKHAVVPRLLELSTLRTMLPLLGFVWLPILGHFLPEARQFCLWLAGDTGVGKSFVARLLQKFYGAFTKPMSWTGTVNSLQRSGYFFRNALALIDDFKPDITNPKDVTRLLQNYADGTARSRLKKDATSNPSREFRGWMLSTGEDLPEHTPSALARTIIVRMPRQQCNHEAGRICIADSGDFPQLTSAFITHVLNNGCGQRFREHVDRYELDLRQRLRGHQNGGRIGRNFAMLLASTWETLDFLIIGTTEKQRLWSAMQESVNHMIADLVRETIAQAPLEILLENLRSLLSSGRVHIRGGHFGLDQISPSGIDNGILIGRTVRGREHLVEINLTAAIEQVNLSRRGQSKSEIKSTHSALLTSMQEAGLLYNREGELWTDEDPVTTQAQLPTADGRRNRRVCTILGTLLGLAPPSPLLGPPFQAGPAAPPA